MTPTFAVETVINDVGHLDHDTGTAIRDILGPDSSLTTHPATGSLHLYWVVTADTAEEALHTALIQHNQAKNLTGVYIPHTSLITVRERETAPVR